MTLDDAAAPTRREPHAPIGSLPVVEQYDPDASNIQTIDPTAVTDASHPGTDTAPVEVAAAVSTDTAPVDVDTPVSTLAAASFVDVESDAVLVTTVAAGTSSTGFGSGPSGSGNSPTPSGRTALAWVDESTVGQTHVPVDLTVAATAFVPVETDLLADAPRRTPLRASVIVPTLIAVGVVGAYAGTTLLWPLHSVAPTVSAIEVQPAAAPVTTPAFPPAGSAAVAVQGMPGVAASAVEPEAIASITKVVTALVVLDEMPLAVGEQGPEYRFTAADRTRYWQYRNNGESALDVPAGGSLTQYQMLEGMLIGSANNYADRLAQTIWPTDAVFERAATEWLSTHGVPGVTIVEPTGMDARNAASPEALIVLAQKALANPVIAQIVATQSVDLPGAGLVDNTNGLLADPGVVGIKTGTLNAWNLLSAKDITVGDTTVRLFASVLGQPDDDARLAASRALYTQLETELQLKPSVTGGTVAGRVETKWGESVDIVIGEDASVVLWNGGSGTVGTTYDLGDSREEGDSVGSLTVTGPLDTATVDLRLAADVDDPSPWWRLTHPLDLFGLND
ncbi:D-alanyl-D-alanine carboxypeptidase family protein [Microbacterium allomyrinae]|uniref:D-alanyl-D-alanine carboxypeptidase n=1 Tax=Microbacterium allomyrinae TaxID=2830666 RepID=A0A9X1S1J1_9MICO|nr:D-alanyl-D-alanine carboxypeptidase [Microbacterium allomyrinae]MCC2031736.1 D-alanyl-D-alanine carboxypeptidase [Microbacterium allomyrinae]